MSMKGETMSDSMSDCTRGSTIGSREDLQDLALSLGLPSVELLAQDRFKVDRKRLETLMFGNENCNAAATFFDSIMQDTRTRITWPSRLKLGAKSRKDPHIRIIGRAEDILVARTKILASLDIKCNRVTVKVDVSYTDHSHIIGKGGFTIKKVMDETGCHIHFPDSNRTNQTEKSNLVSIAGDVRGVERARAKVRELSPLIFGFELPILGSVMMHNEPVSPFIRTLQENYNVQVMFRSRQKLNSTLVLVKGCEWEVNMVKEATTILINHMCESLASQVLESVHMMVEISPQHHDVVLGRNNMSLKGIMQRTSTQIVFQDPNDPNIPSLKKSNVTITGSINNVYLARQQLIGSLPVVLMFDVSENWITIDSEKISELMNNLDVIINTRHKPKQNIISFIIKGIERNVGNIYEARRQLIAPNDFPIPVYIPKTYYIPNVGPTFKDRLFGGIYGGGMMVGPLWGGRGGAPGVWGHPPLPPTHHYLLPQQHHIPLRPQTFHTGEHLGHFSCSSLSLPELPVYSSLSGNTSPLSSPNASPRTVSPVPIPQEPVTVPDLNPSFNNHQKRKAPGFERQALTPSEYKRLKLQAVQAIQKEPQPVDHRIPNSTWSGYGLSHSGPEPLLKGRSEEERNLQECWLNMVGDLSPNMGVGSGEVQLSVSNYLDGVDGSTLAELTSLNPPDLLTLLADIGLDKYMQLFNSHEIDDLETFLSLTEADLKEIGVSSFGARRKMVLCIADLNKRKRHPFRGSAAPGAERKSSSTNSLNE